MVKAIFLIGCLFLCIISTGTAQRTINWMDVAKMIEDIELRDVKLQAELEKLRANAESNLLNPTRLLDIKPIDQGLLEFIGNLTKSETINVNVTAELGCFLSEITTFLQQVNNTKLNLTAVSELIKNLPDMFSSLPNGTCTGLNDSYSINGTRTILGYMASAILQNGTLDTGILRKGIQGCIALYNSFRFIGRTTPPAEVTCSTINATVKPATPKQSLLGGVLGAVSGGGKSANGNRLSNPSFGRLSG